MKFYYIRILIAFFSLIIFTGVIYSQNYLFREYNVEHGLAQSEIYDIYLDREGFLWFGTDGGGVSRFDSKEFTHFTKQDGLTHNIINRIIQDSKGNHWFGSYGGGVSKYDGKNFTNYTAENELNGDYIYALYEDPDGKIWIGTDGGISIYDAGKFSYYTTKDGLRATDVMEIYRDSRGALWIGTYEGGVMKYDQEGFSVPDELSALKDLIIYVIREDSKGNLWIGTDGKGVFKLAPGGDKPVHYNTENGLSNNTVWDIIEDDDGMIWLTTYGGGVCRFDGRQFQTYDRTEGLSHDRVWVVEKDLEGNLWFGTDGGGTCQLRKTAFRHLTTQSGLSHDRVISLLEDSKGNIWIGTDGEGVDLYSNGQFRQISTDDGLPNNSVWSIMEDRQGNVWFGTDEGVAVAYNNGKLIRELKGSEVLDNHVVYSVFQDSKGEFWFTTYAAGVVHYDGKRFTNITREHGLINEIVYDVVEDGNGAVWFATEGGVTEYSGKQEMRHLTESDGLSEDIVVDLEFDKHGHLWMATYGGGVNRYDGSRVEVISMAHGLSGDAVQSVKSDGNVIWVGTINGLNKIVLDEQRKVVKVEAMQNREGFRGIECSQKALMIDDRGHIWMGLSKGVIYFDREDRVINSKPPNTSITGVFLFQSEDSISRYVNGEQMGKAGLPMYPELSWDQNYITFRFRAVSYTLPEKVNYRYMLEGFDKDWSSPKKEEFVTYSNLPPGNYTFKVIASNNSDVWNDTPATYHFSIAPPFWETAWFRVGSILLIISAIYGWNRYRIRKLKKQKEHLEKVVQERTHEIREQKQVIEQKNKDIIDSIEYAKLIQRSILPAGDVVKQILPESFILYMPKDIVSGDFYWMAASNGEVVVTAADCTGHGVPGAFMSMIGANTLEQLVNREGITEPAAILDRLHIYVKQTLKQGADGSKSNDGMDLALINIKGKDHKVEYAGAHRPLWIIRKGELIEVKADKFPIGGMQDGEERKFTNHTLDVEKGDMLYFFSDGYPDQFGGEKNKKFMTKRFKKLLLEIAENPLEEQKKTIKEELLNWMGDHEQVDDVLVIGVRVE